MTPFLERSCRIACMLVLALPIHAAAQQAGTVAAPSAVRGLYNWIHSTGDAERSFPFYRDVLGIELARSPFAGPPAADAPPERIRPVSNAAPDPLIWNLTDTKGARFRNVFMRATNTPFGLELSEFLDIPRAERPPNPWDPGASRLVFFVRDLDGIMARLAADGAPSVTHGGRAVDTPRGRSFLVRDPDGYLVQVTQASPADIAAARSPGQVVGTAIGLSVADTAAALRFYKGLLGFNIVETRRGTSAELQLNGLPGGRLTQTAMRIPGTEILVLLDEFAVPAGVPAATPIRWRIQDVGAPQFQLQVTGLDALIDNTKRSGYRFLSVGAKPIQRAFGRFVFAIDPDGVLVEFAEPAPTR